MSESEFQIEDIVEVKFLGKITNTFENRASIDCEELGIVLYLDIKYCTVVSRPKSIVSGAESVDS